MFEDTLLESSSGRAPALTRRRRIISIVAATIVEFSVVGALVLVPLIRTEALDLNRVRDQTRIHPPPRKGVQIISVAHERKGKAAPSPDQERTIIAPDRIPLTIPQVTEEGGPSVGPDIALTLSDSGIPGVPDGVEGGLPLDPARNNPPPELHELKSKSVERRVVGSTVQAAKLMVAPKPEYPLMARIARVQGTVRIEALIGADGRVQDLRVTSGHPMLVKAALDAVSQWRYRPTLLNGEAVEVQTEIVVNFILGE